MRKKLWMPLLAMAILTGCSNGQTKEQAVPVEQSKQQEESLPETKEDTNLEEGASSKEDVNLEEGVNPKEDVKPEEDTNPKKDIHSEKDNVLKISEKMFLTQINDIYSNFEEYKDKTIYVQGMYTLMNNINDPKLKARAVYRKGPGCCGNDGWGGFLLNFTGQKEPKENDWIEVVGKPKIVQNGKYKELYLDVESVTVMKERGAEYVEQ